MDRRTIWAILLMMVIAVAPALLLKKPAPGPGEQRAGDSLATPDPAPAAAAPTPAADIAGDTADAREAGLAAGADTLPRATAPAGPAVEDTVRVTSPLYTYGFSTRGARLVQAELLRYASMAPGQEGERASERVSGRPRERGGDSRQRSSPGAGRHLPRSGPCHGSGTRRR